MWTLHQQQQQCGAQTHARNGGRPPAEAPDEALADRSAQDHDRADLDVGGAVAQPGDSPASPIENLRGDPATGIRTGTAPVAPGDANADWDEVVQPEQQQFGELYEDGRDEAAEVTADQTGALDEGPARFDRND